MIYRIFHDFFNENGSDIEKIIENLCGGTNRFIRYSMLWCGGRYISFIEIEASEKIIFEILVSFGDKFVDIPEKIENCDDTLFSDFTNHDLETIKSVDATVTKMTVTFRFSGVAELINELSEFLTERTSSNV